MQHLQLTVGNIRELLSLQCFYDGKQVDVAHVQQLVFADPIIHLSLLSDSLQYNCSTTVLSSLYFIQVHTSTICMNWALGLQVKSAS